MCILDQCLSWHWDYLHVPVTFRIGCRAHCTFCTIGINPLEGVVMLASTNRVDILDQALLRPGRFDRQILINLPTLPERKAIFEVYLKKILLEKSVDTYSSRLAALTPGHSGKSTLCMLPVSFEINICTIHLYCQGLRSL